MFKKTIAFTLSVIIVLLNSVIDLSATSLIPSDDSTHYYFGNALDFTSWSADQLLTQSNYSVANEFPGDLSLNVANTFYSQNGNFTDTVLFNTLTGDYTVDVDKIDINNTYFKPIVIDNDTIPISACKKVCGIQYGANKLYNILLYSPSNTDIAFGTGYRAGFFSENDFYMSVVEFPLSFYDYNNIRVFQFGSGTNENQIFSTVQNQQGFPTDSKVCRLDELSNIFYSETTILFQALENNATYGESSLYRYDLMANYGYNWLHNVDISGFCQDRRTSSFIEQVNPVSLIDDKLGVLIGSYNHLFTGLSYNDCCLFIGYQLNDYTKALGNNVSLKIDYNISLEGEYRENYFEFNKSFSECTGYLDSYNIFNSNYIQIDMSKVFSMIRTNYTDTSVNHEFSIINAIPTNSAIQEISSFSVKDIFDVLIRSGGFGLAQKKQYVSNVWDDIASKADNVLGYVLSSSYSFYENSSRQGVFDNAYMTITEYLETAEGKKSDVNIWTYNFMTQQISNVGGFENNSEQDTDFGGFYMDNIFAKNDNGLTDTSGQYAIQPYSSATVGNIYINSGLSSIPYILVDIPENQWMAQTPNLNTLLNDFKSMLAETKENSILNMLPSTYSYFPAPVMQYLLYGVGLIVMIGIWRAITRR